MSPSLSDPRIDAYIADSAEFARPILKHLRKLVRTACPDVTETMKWSAPFWVHGGRTFCMMAAFKEHCAFGFWKRNMVEISGRASAKANTAMGDFGRITRLADLPNDKTMLRYIRTAAQLNESGAPARAPTKPKPEVKVPADLAAALRKRKPASATFAKLSPSCRREYVDWITDAKRDETRQKRLATTLQWLADGKSRHWKYEEC